MRFILAASLTACFSAASLPAQKTWKVDPSGKGDFKTIQAAVDKAAHGDTVILTTASYRERITVNKGLTLLGQGSKWVGVAGVPLTVKGLPAGRTFTLSSATIEGYLLQDNLGSVHIEAAVQATGSSVQITNCAHVSLTRCKLTGWITGSPANSPGLTIKDSTVVLVDTEAVGGAEMCGYIGQYYVCVQGAPGLLIDGARSRVTIHGGKMTGGFGGKQPGGYGVALNAGSLRIGNSGGTVVAAGSSRTGSSAAIYVNKNGSLFVDPLVTLTPVGTSTKVNGRVVYVPMVGLQVSGAAPGGSVASTIYAPAGSTSALYYAAPSAPQTAVFGDLWLDLNTLVLVDISKTPANGQRAKSYTVPKGVPRGTTVYVQALNASKNGTWLSLPAPLTIH